MITLIEKKILNLTILKIDKFYRKREKGQKNSFGKDRIMVLGINKRNNHWIQRILTIKCHSIKQI